MAIVKIGTSNEFNAGVYGATHENTLGFLRGQMESLQNVSSNFSNHLKGFVEKAKDAYSSFLDSDLLRRSKAALDRFGSVFQENNIRWLRNETEVQQAPPAMIPFVMANPVIRNLFQEQRCEGSGDAYVDNEPGLVGKDHTHYQLAMSGIVQEDNDGVMKYTIWDNGETPLSTEEKVAVASTWDMVELMVAQAKKDPTSQKGGRL